MTVPRGDDSDRLDICGAPDMPGDASLPVDGLFIGRGWYPFESYGGETFRWVDNHAEIIVTAASGVPRRLCLEVEPGPGLGSRPCQVKMLGSVGTGLGTFDVVGRQTVTVDVRLPPGSLGVLRLEVPGGGRAIGDDPRVLNLRVFGFGWAGPREETRPPEMEYLAEGWGYARARPLLTRQDAPEIVDFKRRNWPGFVSAIEAPRALGVSFESDRWSNADLAHHNTIRTFAYVLARAARGLDAISMLDWGGGVGHYLALARTLLPELRVAYHSRDLPAVVRCGAELLPDEHFYADDRCLDASYDLVMASGSLHYVEDWSSLLQRLAAATRRYLFVTRLPMASSATSFVFVQRWHAHQFVGWCLNRNAFLDEAGRIGLTLEREFVVGETYQIAGAPEHCQYRGFLFRPQSAQLSL
jgi:putative methyltransferase (TIGR04325 family)